MELIVTHSNTDFDGLAAQLAAQKLYPHALAMLNRRLRDNVAEFEALYREYLPFVHEDDLPDRPVSRLIVVDTPEAPSLPGLDGERVPTLIIDHHPRSRDPLPHEELEHAEIGAVTSLLVEQLDAANIALSPVEATLMLLGIYEDTGSLSFSSTRQADVAAAAWLLGYGARIEAISEFLHRPLNAEQERVFRQLEQHMRLETINGWNVLLASAQIEGDVPQLAALAGKLNDVYAPTVTALAIGTGDRGVQLILRADPEVADIGAVARGFGGGGHAAAAAAFVRDRAVDELVPEIEAAIRRVIRPALNAAAIMTRWVRTISIESTVAQADTALARSGHTALPVIDQERIVHGIITRRDLASAIRHGRGEASVRRYMLDEPPLVAPDMLVRGLRQRLAESDAAQLGRLIVVDNNKHLLGIISRSDLLDASDAVPEHDTGVVDILETYLDPLRLALIRRAASLAEARDETIYLVGGFVRDMLLDRPSGDLDLLVEGDAIALAQQLADQLNGELVEHAQFGTATIELAALDDRVLRTLAEDSPLARTVHEPIALDFITARTEFYDAPAALPAVEASSLRHDLHRRDFTINTLAVGLDGARYGRLYDFFGGRRDIERKLIRVLHNLSFLDDPTRMLRAARLAARLGFSIEPRTRDLIEDALDIDMLRRTSPQRIANELRLVLLEEAPEHALELLDTLGVLRAIHNALGWTSAQSAQLRAMRQILGSTTPLFVLGFVTYPLEAAARDELIAYFQPSHAVSRLFNDIGHIQQFVGLLREPVANSVLDHMLQPISEDALRTAQFVEAKPVSAQIAHYLEHVRPTRTLLNGHDLLAMGIKAGPGMGHMLKELRAARLDGLVSSRDEEVAWVQQQTTQ